MQFKVLAAAIFATAASAAAVPTDFPVIGGPGPVQSGGSCAADDGKAPHIPYADCKEVLAELRSRGNSDLIACDLAWRTHYNYAASKNGRCQVITEANGDPQCKPPHVVADGVEAILRLCSKKRRYVLPGSWSYFNQGVTIRIAAGKQ